MTSSFNRQLTDLERELIHRVTRVMPPEIADVLSGQLSQASVLDDGMPLALTLAVTHSVGAVELPDGPLPVSAEIWDGKDYQGELIAFVASGYLSLFEYAWVTDDIPPSFPDPDAVQIKPI